MVFSLAGWSPLLPTRFLVSRSTLDTAALARLSPTGLSPSPACFPKTVPLGLLVAYAVLTPACFRTPVWAPPFSLAATQGIDFSFFSSGYLDVSVHRVPLHNLWIQLWIHGSSPCGFPHSETRGSLGICPSPRLFAAYHVFHRPLVPRHPPCALTCLTSSRHTSAAAPCRFLMPSFYHLLCSPQAV